MNIKDFGHWTILETEYTKDGVDLDKYIGFVYVITFDDGTKYVGAKKIWQRIKRPPCTFKRGPQKGFSQSEWKTYMSSSQTVLDKIDSGQKPKEFLIIGFYDTWGKTLFAEMLIQIRVNVFVGSTWLNHRIDGCFLASCYDLTVENNTTTYMKHLEDPETHKKFKYGIELELNDEGKTYNIFNELGYVDAVQLLTGIVDEVNGFRLPINIRRRSWAVLDNGKEYRTKTEYMKEKGLTNKEFDALDILNVPETRKEYRARLLKELKLKEVREYK